MTRSHRNQGIAACPHCRKIIDGLPEPPFNAWVRDHPLLDSSPGGAAIVVTDIDIAIHRYQVKDKSTRRPLGRQDLMYIEVKSRMKKLGKADSQYDTLGAVCQHAWAPGARKIRITAHGQTVKGPVNLTHHGLHLLELSGYTPDDSDEIRWNHKLIDKATLVDILRFKINASTLEPLEDRSHHKADPLLDEEWGTID